MGIPHPLILHAALRGRRSISAFAVSVGRYGFGHFARAPLAHFAKTLHVSWLCDSLAGHHPFRRPCGQSWPSQDMAECAVMCECVVHDLASPESRS